MTRIVPDDTRPKYRIVQLENQKFSIQKKFLWWWIFIKIHIPVGFADWQQVVMEFDSIKKASDWMKETYSTTTTSKYKIVKKFNSEGIEV